MISRVRGEISGSPELPSPYCVQVSVPQSELLSLISAAKSLGIRGLAEDGPEAGDTSEVSTEAGERLASLVIMGGNMEAIGNVTPSAEFNFHADPEAAHTVLR